MLPYASDIHMNSASFASEGHSIDWPHPLAAQGCSNFFMGEASNRMILDIVTSTAP